MMLKKPMVNRVFTEGKDPKGGDGSTYSQNMKDARFTIPTPALLSKVVDMLDHVPMEDRDTKGDLYEYMLGKIASAGQNGQFRTPRHIIKLMVELTAPNAKNVICDPASGTCGFLVAAGEYLRDKHPELFNDSTSRRISTPACSTTTTSPSTVVHEAVELLLSKTQHARNGHPHFLFSPLSAK